MQPANISTHPSLTWDVCFAYQLEGDRKLGEVAPGTNPDSTLERSIKLCLKPPGKGVSCRKEQVENNQCNYLDSEKLLPENSCGRHTYTHTHMYFTANKMAINTKFKIPTS